MRPLLTWLMVFCVMAGLNVLILGAEPSPVCQDSKCAIVEVVCCGHTHEPASCDHPHDGQECPKDHHHHHNCCAASQPLTIENDHFREPGFFGSSLESIRHDGETAPEEPFLGSEKPPLI